MRNLVLLIRKDLLTALIAPSTTVMILLLFVCLVAVNPALAFVLVIYMMVVNLFAQEENDLVCNVTGILPIRMAQAVLARYLYAWLLLLVTLVAGAVISGGLNTFAFHTPDWMASLLLALAAALIMTAVIMPLNYKLGVVRARVASMVIYILMVVVSTVISTGFRVFSVLPPDGHGPAETAAQPLSVVAIAGIAVAIGLVLSVISLLISLRIKKN